VAHAPNNVYDPMLDPDVFGDVEPVPTAATVEPPAFPALIYDESFFADATPAQTETATPSARLPRRNPTAAELMAIVERAIAEGRHPRMDVLNNVNVPEGVCGACRQWAPIWHELGVGGGAGIAGRVQLCRQCAEARGIK
jgi:hypothetical protein